MIEGRRVMDTLEARERMCGTIEAKMLLWHMGRLTPEGKRVSRRSPLLHTILPGKEVSTGDRKVAEVPAGEETEVVVEET